MKRAFLLALCAVCLLLLFSCVGEAPSDEGVKIVDDLGGEAYIKADAKVVACYASFGECWQLAGGTLVGVTSDALDEGRIEGADKLSVVGTVKAPDPELISKLAPDYVILSADLAAHVSLRESLTALGIRCGYFSVDTFMDYSSLMARFCAVTDREDLFAEHVTAVGERIKEILNKIPEDGQQSVLLMRAYSTGIKAKTDDNLAGQILSEFGLINIADETPSLLEDMSLEHIVARDPEYIFVLTMGSEESARAYLEKNLESNPAWAGLSAVKNEKYEILPKDLFHYKPNNRWDESYEYLARIIYPDIFG